MARRHMGRGGVASDGKNPFVTTGNTVNTGGNWDGGEAVIRFQPGPIFSGFPGRLLGAGKLARSRRPGPGSGWLGPITGGRTWRNTFPSYCCAGKDRKAYLVNRDNLGGITPPIASATGCQQHYSPGRGHLSN